MKRILLLLTLIFTFPPLFSADRIPVVLEVFGQELHTSFCCFNELSDGKKSAADTFGFRQFDALVAAERRRVIPVPLGSDVGLYDYALFCYGNELWFFHNKGDGYLWGAGTVFR